MVISAATGPLVIGVGGYARSGVNPADLDAGAPTSSNPGSLHTGLLLTLDVPVVDFCYIETPVAADPERRQLSCLE